MLQMNSFVEVADNTGVKRVRVIRFLGQNRRTGGVGEVFVGSVREVTPGSSITKGSVIKAVVVGTKRAIARKNGSFLRFDTNTCVIVDATHNPRGTRVLSPVASELRQGFMKIVSLAPEVV